VAAVVAGLVAEWRARRAAAREEARETKRLQRDEYLRGIEDTRRDYLASVDYQMARLVGQKEKMASIEVGRRAFPAANIYLLGDEGLIRQVDALTTELSRRAEGSGISESDVGRVGAQQGHVMSRLDAQRSLVLQGEEPAWPSARFVKEMLETASARWGVPADYVPRVKDDTARP
jgi:hypothetical protein